jgi:hypothetical protein
MRNRVAYVLTTLLFAAAAAAEPASLSFTATGDGPRSEEDWMLFQKQIDTDNADGKHAFLLHLGDIWKGSDRLPESHYLQVAALLRTSIAPVYIVPGDNEWTDLDNPAEGWLFWSNHLLKLDEHWKKEIAIDRHPDHPELLAWTQNGVTMIGVNVVGGDVKDPDEWKARHAYCLKWVEDNVTKYRDNVRAAVVFGQARPKPIQEDFFAPFVETAKTFGKPVLYLHGDGHKYEVEEHWRAPNITRAQVDQVAKARPLLITVTMDPQKPFTFDRRLDN